MFKTIMVENNFYINSNIRIDTLKKLPFITLVTCIIYLCRERELP